MLDGPSHSGNEPRPGDAELRRYAKRWTTEIIRTSHVPLSRAEIQGLLLDLTALLSDIVLGEPFTPGRAEAVGERLVDAHFTGAGALGGTAYMMITGLAEAAGVPDHGEHRERIVRICEAVASGYVEALRERLLTDQEMMKKAVLNAKEAAERSRLATEARFRAVFASSAIGIGIGDLDGHILQTNPAIQEILGYTEPELLQHTMRDLVHPEDWRTIHTQLDLVRLGYLNRFVDNVRFIGKGGEEVWTHLSLSLVRDEHGQPLYPVAMVENVTEVHLLQRQLHRQNIQDPVTGLANRTQLVSRLHRALATSDRSTRVGLCFLDIDGFKVINDGLGAATGDQVLGIVAAKLLEAVADRDAVVARISGDGFAIVLADSAGIHDVITLVEEIQEQLGEPVYLGENGVATSVSVGIVEQEADGTLPEDLLRAAEIAVHRAKAQGKAQWATSSADSDAVDRRRFQLGAVMPGALETGEFAQHYRPVVSLADGTVVAIRSETRWHHPTLGVLEPVDFVDIAEETGLIIQLGRWVLRDTCRQAGEWRTEFGPEMPPVEFGIPSRLARDEDFIGSVPQLLEKSGVDAAQFRLALPADSVVDEQGDPADALSPLPNAEISSIVRGFGLGGGTLTGLTELKAHGIEIDSVAVAALERAGAASPLARGLTALVDLAHEFGLTVTAAGVDTERRLGLLRPLGVDTGHGDALARLYDADEIQDALGLHPTA